MENKIKVLQCVGVMVKGGGIESLLMNIFRNIDREKFDFTFLCSTKIKGDYDEEIFSLGGHIIYMPELNKKSIFSFIKSYKERKIYLQSLSGYDIVHIHGANSFAVYYRAKYLSYKNKTILVHSHASNGIRYKLIHYFFRKKFKNLKITKLACSKMAADWMYGERGKDTIILKNAINTENFIYNKIWRNDINQSLNLGNSFIIGHVGRFVIQKNHEFIINVFNELLKLQPNSRLLLVGNGHMQNKIKQQVDFMGLGEKVIFAGVRGDVNVILSAMDIFLLPSFNEGSPFAAIEAAASGLKCFISDSITDELKVLKNIEYLSLDKGPLFWAKKIIEAKDYERENREQELIDTGYNIKGMVKNLEDLYLDKIGGLK